MLVNVCPWLGSIVNKMCLQIIALEPRFCPLHFEFSVSVFVTPLGKCGDHTLLTLLQLCLDCIAHILIFKLATLQKRHSNVELLLRVNPRSPIDLAAVPASGGVLRAAQPVRLNV